MAPRIRPPVYDESVLFVRLPTHTQPPHMTDSCALTRFSSAVLDVLQPRMMLRYLTQLTPVRISLDCRVDPSKSGGLNLLRVHSPRCAASASYRRTMDQSPGQAPVSREPDWISCQAPVCMRRRTGRRNDGSEQKTRPRSKLWGSSLRSERCNRWRNGRVRTERSA